jgi:hypothetical protein
MDTTNMTHVGNKKIVIPKAMLGLVTERGFHDAPMSLLAKQDEEMLPAVRDRLTSRRTAVINQLSAFLLERGIVFAQKPTKLKAAMADILDNAEADELDNGVPKNVVVVAMANKFARIAWVALSSGNEHRPVAA